MYKIILHVYKDSSPEKYYVDGTEDYINLKKDMIDKTKKLVWK